MPWVCYMVLFYRKRRNNYHVIPRDSFYDMAYFPGTRKISCKIYKPLIINKIPIEKDFRLEKKLKIQN
ncbi:MAG: hypothetical protein EA411_01070 [Saprospirales bacterium]|nr:MAG: hypothetical protein EA411_01070 [Saprospirales bacterium]